MESSTSRSKRSRPVPVHQSPVTFCVEARLTFVLSLLLSLNLLIDLLCKFSPDIPKVRHRYSSVLEALLRLLELIVGEPELANQVANSLCHASAGKQVAERMDTVDDFGEVLLVVQVDRLKDKVIRQADVLHKIEEVVDVVNMLPPELGFRVL